MRFTIFTILSFTAFSIANPLPQTPASRDVELRGAKLNSFVAVLLDHLPQVNGAIDKVASVMTAFEKLVAFITGEKTTYNDLSGSCKPYTVVFARGTLELGNVGILVGPPFFQALKDRLGAANIAVQGIKYDAVIDGYFEGGDPAGSIEMANQIQVAYSKCPSTKLIASGYSQGGQLLHNSISKLPANVAAWIHSGVIFGDPLNGKAIPNLPSTKVKTYCDKSDDICVNGALILPSHLAYAQNAEAAAAFVVSA